MWLRSLLTYVVIRYNLVIRYNSEKGLPKDNWVQCVINFKFCCDSDLWKRTGLSDIISSDVAAIFGNVRGYEEINATLWWKLFRWLFRWHNAVKKMTIRAVQSCIKMKELYRAAFSLITRAALSLLNIGPYGIFIRKK